MKKRIISFFTALSMTLMLFTGIPISVSAVVGDLASDGYQLDDNGKLTIENDTGMTKWKRKRATYKDQVISVEIKSGVTSIVERAFHSCESLSSITIPNSVTSIGFEAFTGCVALSGITIPNSVTSIGDSAFSGCTELRSVTIPNSVTSIGKFAFTRCTGLNSITIPASVTEMGLDIILNANNIKTVTFEGAPPNGSSDIDGDNITTIYVPCSSEEAYKNGDVIDSSLKGKIRPVHTPAQVAAKTATCAAEGNVAHWHCSQCDKNFTDNTCATEETDVIIPKTDNHTWNAGTVTTAATCTTTGVKTYTCSVCGATKTETIPKTAHSYGSAWSKDADQHWKVCTKCNEAGTKENHAWDSGTVTTPPTEEDEGVKTYTCTVCSKTKTESIDKLEHTHDWSDTYQSDSSQHWKVCTKCNEAGTKENHAWDSGTVTTEPTEDTEGEKTYTCTICSATKTESLDKLTHTHTLTSHAAVPATCTTNGNEAYWTCSGCDKIFSDENGTTEITEIPTIPAGHKYSEDWEPGDNEHWHECTVCHNKKDIASHTWNDGIVTKPATEDAEGVKTYTCTVCSATKTESIDKLEHTHDWSDTYQSDGSQHWKVCTKCNEAGTKENHVWNSGTVTTPPTEDTEGVRTYTCTVCSATKTESIDKLEHTHDWSDTYQSDGSQHWKVCTKCNEASTKENHVWDSGTVTIQPTEEAAGVKTYTCTVCSATKTESIAQLVHTHTYSTEWTSDSTSHWYAATCGHDVVSEMAAHTEDGGTVTVPATTENDGLKTYACSVCGYVMRTVTIPKLGEDHNHSFSPDWKHDSTSHWHECDCGEKNEIAPHIENGGVVTTEPTETSTGIMTYSCSVCGYVMRTDVIPALIPEHNHNFGTDWKYDSVSHWHECECGEKSDIANHISSDWIVVTPATTDLEGVQIRKCTVCDIEIDRETIEKLPNISTGDVAEDVRDTAGTNAGLVQDNTLIENVLTPEDNIAVENGSSFEIVLEVTDIRDSVPAADVTAVSSALRYNEQIGIYVDLSLFKIKDNSERTPIYNTNGRIGITLTVPDSIYASDRTYSIIRVHDGIAENLGGTYDKASRELTFYTDKFSTYAIAYAASNSGTDRPTVPDTPTYPSVPTYPNTPVVPVTPTVTETTVKKEEEVISDEPYVEDVSSAAGIYESGETDNNIHYVMILIFAAAAGIAAIAAKKHFCKKNMK